jgi:CheY-like chemotaxis protein
MPVLICTASTRPEHEAACLAAGANAFLTKPFSPAGLASLVGQLDPELAPRLTQDLAPPA